ncbi:MAG: DUF6476 family protein [Maritimibacter sp.]
MGDTPISDTAPSDTALSDKDAALLRYLKALVTTLSVTMIAGVIVLIVVIVMRFNATPRAALPENLILPSGVAATAVTRGADWLGVVTDDGRILIYELDGVTLRQEITLQPGE